MNFGWSGYYGWRFKHIDDDLDDPQKNEWREQGKRLEPSGTSCVYVLSLEEHEHSGDESEHTMVGVYNSKLAAIAGSSTVELGAFGRIDDAMAQWLEAIWEDNREHPPDDGVLLEFHVEEGDYARLHIKKMEVLGLPAGKTDKQPDTPSSNASSEESSRKISNEGEEEQCKKKPKRKHS